MRVIGLDCAVNTGMVVLDRLDGHEGESVIEEAYVFKNKVAGKDHDFHIDRWYPYMGRLQTLLSVYRPEMVVFEAYGYSSQSLAVSVALGTLMRYTIRIHDKDIVIIEVAPNTLKKFVTGAGNSPKDVMLLEVFKRWGFDTSSNDEADAFALAKVGEALMGADVGLPKANMESLKVIQKANATQLAKLK